MLELDWSSLFVPTRSLAEVFVRGTVIYLALFLAMRFLPRRAVGAMEPSDLLVVVLIADAVQNAMSGGYESVSEGVLLAAVIFGWATFIDYMDFKFPDLHLVAPGPVVILRDGKLLHRNMAKQHLTEDEVRAQLRERGVGSERDVSAAYVEGDGTISVILRAGKPMKPPRKTPE